MKHLHALALAAPLCLVTPGAMAWNGRGHMVVAAVAWDHMSERAQKRASDLLKLNPFYKSWVDGVDEKNQNQIAFVIGATWPDQIKKWHGNCPKVAKPNSGPISRFTYCSDTDHPTHEGAAANTGYTDRLEHKYWHFIDIPFSPDATQLIQPVPPNAQTQIDLFRTTLMSDSVSDELKSYDLVWLEHLVGDVHQPLHATSRFTKAFPKGDQGGNLVCTGTALKTNPKGVKACKTELHAFWDGILGNQKSGATEADNARTAITAAKTLEAADQTKVADDGLDHWIMDSFELAKSTAYAPPVKQKRGPYNVSHSAAYKSDATDTGRAQAALAGERLAKLLDKSLR